MSHENTLSASKNQQPTTLRVESFFEKYFCDVKTSTTHEGFFLLQRLALLDDTVVDLEDTGLPLGSTLKDHFRVRSQRDREGKRESEGDKSFLTQFDRYASLFPTDPFTAVIEDLTNEKEPLLIVSPAKFLDAGRVADLDVLRQRDAALRAYCCAADADQQQRKIEFYECLYNTYHPYLFSCYRDYKSELEKVQNEDAIGEIAFLERHCNMRKSPSEAEILEDQLTDRRREAFIKFVEHCSGEKDLFSPSILTPLLRKYEMDTHIKSLAPTGNVPHVEMVGIQEALKQYKKKDKRTPSTMPIILNVGLAFRDKHNSVEIMPTCGGCSAEIKALREIKNITINTHAESVYSLPMSFYNFSNLTMAGQKVPKSNTERCAGQPIRNYEALSLQMMNHILTSPFMTSVAERAEIHLKASMIPNAPPTTVTPLQWKVFLHDLSAARNSLDTAIETPSHADQATTAGPPHAAPATTARKTSSYKVATAITTPSDQATTAGLPRAEAATTAAQETSSYKVATATISPSGQATTASSQRAEAATTAAQETSSYKVATAITSPSGQATTAGPTSTVSTRNISLPRLVIATSDSSHRAEGATTAAREAISHSELAALPHPHSKPAGVDNANTQAADYLLKHPFSLGTFSTSGAPSASEPLYTSPIPTTASPRPSRHTSPHLSRRNSPHLTSTKTQRTS